MDDDVQQTLRELTAWLWVLPVEDYLASDEFTRFCREHDLSDAWREYLRLSEDRPDLYGRSVVRSAFSLFLHHILHRRKEEFLHLFSALMADFSKGISCDLPVDDIKSALLLLGYSESELDHALFLLRVRQRTVPGQDTTCCTPEKKET